MYRVFCESYENYKKNCVHPDVRLSIAEPFELIVNTDKFEAAREKEALEYKKLCDMLHYASRNTDRYPQLKAFLWTLSSRGMLPQFFGVSDDGVLEEQVKLAVSFFKLAYWE